MLQCCKKWFLEWLMTFLSEGSKYYQDQGVEEPLRVEILIKKSILKILKSEIWTN